MDLGDMEVEYQGRRSKKHMIRIVFESEAVVQGTGVRCSVDKRFTLSLHPKSGLADFCGKWRGRPVMENETIDLAKLVGACCTLVISHRQNAVGRTIATIDAVTKPTKKVIPSGQYDPAKARERHAEWVAKESGGLAPTAPVRTAPVVAAPAAVAARPAPVAAAAPGAVAAPAAATFPVAAASSAPVGDGFDPEVGF